MRGYPLFRVCSAAVKDGSDWQGFSNDAFLDVLRDVFFPGAVKTIVECEGIRVRTLLEGSRHAVSGFWQMPFFLEPLSSEIVGAAVHVPFIDAVVQATTVANEAGPAGLEPAPFVRWRDFDSWDAFISSRPKIEGLDPVSTVRRKEARLARDVGPLEFRVNDDDPAVLEEIFRWKSEQYRRTGIADRFAIPEIRDLYMEMRRQKILVVSSLRAGDRLVAGNVGSRMGRRFLTRIPAYDKGAAKHSPGAILKLCILKASFDAGDDEFDFGVGGERYKFAYATHIRWFGPIGREPVAARFNRAMRGWAGGKLQNRGAYFLYRRVVHRLHSGR